MSRPPFTPTDDQRRIVCSMSSYGVPQDDIALVVRCSPPTLRKRFRDELDLGTIEANAKVAQCPYQQAITPGNLGATIFWLKARAGWREVQRVENTGANGAPMATEIIYRWATDEELTKGQTRPEKPRIDANAG